MDALSLADDCLKGAIAAGAHGAEVFAISYNTKSVYIEQDVPKVAEERHENGLGLKVSRGKRVAFTSTCLQNSKDLKTAIASAMRSLNMIPDNPDFNGFTSEQGSGRISGVFNAKTADASLESLVEITQDLTSSSKIRKDVWVPKGILRLQDYSIRIVNSEGVDGRHRGTLTFLYFTARSGTMAKGGEGIVKSISTSLSGHNFSELGRKLGERSIANLTATSLRERVSGTVILDPMDLGEMLIQSVGEAVNGENVQKGRSPWQDKIGSAVASEQVNIVDNPRLPRGLSSSVSDDEGHRTVKRPLVVNGILKDFVKDHYNSRLLGGSGGNALRRSVATVEGAYSRPAQCSITNLVIEPGTKTPEDLIGTVSRGVYVEKVAAPEVNPFGGAFALEVRNATLIENGSLGRHVKHALMVGNIFDVMKNVAGIGRELKATHGFLLSPGCCYLPTMAFDGCELVGQK